MRYVWVVNSDRGGLLGSRVCVADGWWNRLRGLIGRPPLEAGEGLLLVPCPAVHTFGLSAAIDVAFLDEAGTVIALYPELPPGRLTRWHGRGCRVLETPPGTLGASGTEEGDTITWLPVDA